MVSEGTVPPGTRPSEELRPQNSAARRSYRAIAGSSPAMDNYTSAPSPEEDYEDYDVLIEGDLNDTVTESCDQYDSRILSTQLVLRLYSTLFAVGLLSNVLVVLILVKYKGLRHVENIYFLNVALSNLCFSLTLPFWAHAASQGVLSDSTCRILVGLYSVGLYSEALGGTLLAMHRCLVFLNVRKFSRAVKAVPWGIALSLLVWVMATLLTLPKFTFPTAQREGQVSKCSDSGPYFLPVEEPFWKHFLTVKMNMLGFLLPLLVFLSCSVMMWSALSSREKKHDLHKLALGMLAVFLLMWAPFNLTLFLWAFREHFSLQDCRSSYHLDKAVHITKVISGMHCCVNPFLYLLLDREFRRHLCRGICRVCDCTPRSPAQECTQYPPQQESTH